MADTTLGDLDRVRSARGAPTTPAVVCFFSISSQSADIGVWELTDEKTAVSTGKWQHFYPEFLSKHYNCSEIIKYDWIRRNHSLCTLLNKRVLYINKYNIHTQVRTRTLLNICSIHKCTINVKCLIHKYGIKIKSKRRFI